MKLKKSFGSPHLQNKHWNASAGCSMNQSSPTYCFERSISQSATNQQGLSPRTFQAIMLIPTCCSDTEDVSRWYVAAAGVSLLNIYIYIYMHISSKDWMMFHCTPGPYSSLGLVPSTSFILWKDSSELVIMVRAFICRINHELVPFLCNVKRFWAELFIIVYINHGTQWQFRYMQ